MCHSLKKNNKHSLEKKKTRNF
uniref:Uncharacterized protein n=1 Tax=Anguilla anguilla TaxID=7936 RepID=A0A0E9RA74_ANGAN